MNAPNDAPVVHHKAYLFHRCERPFIVILILALTSVQIFDFQGGETNISSVDDPYGLFSSVAYQNDLYDELGQYCHPELFILCPKSAGVPNYGVEDGVRVEVLLSSLDGGEEKATFNFLVDTEQVFPSIESYSGASPDLPSWLRPITDSVNLQPQSNMTLVKDLTSYTWFVDDTLLREEHLFDAYTFSSNMTATTFQPTGESKFLVYQTNSSTKGANLRTVMYEKIYSSETGEQLTQRLLCCDNWIAAFSGQTLEETFAIDDHSSTESLAICTPSMCSSATQNCSDMALTAVWKFTLASLAKNVVARLRATREVLFGNQYHDTAFAESPMTLPAVLFDDPYHDTAFAESPMNYPYKFNDVLSLLIKERGDRTVQNLLHFFEQRESSTSKQFLEVSVRHFHVTSLPNHCWDINTFMGIIENATAEFQETAPEKSNGVTNDTTIAWPPLDYIDIMNLERPFADAFLHSIRVRRENNWIETTNENQMKLSSSANIVTPNWMDCLLKWHPTELLDGSKCGKAINTTLHVISKLPISEIHDVYLGEQRYVYFVGALMITVSLVQTLIRYQRLPGGRLFKIDKSRVKRRREQLCMALQDEYLCRERELRARQQLGEERAREVLGLLEVAAQRDPDLPPDYQFKQRKISRYFAMSGHILLTLVGPLNDLDGYVNFECGLLFVNLLQSLLEIKAYKLVEQQEEQQEEQHSGTEPPQVGGCNDDLA